MNYKTLNQSVKEQLQGVKWKFAGVLFILISVNILVQQVMNMKDTPQSTFFVVLNLVISLALAVVQNTILFLFVKQVRKEHFGIADIKYSCSKIVVHITTGVVLALLQSVLQTLLLVLISFVPMLADPLLILLQVVFLALTVFVAFGIYDGMGNLSGNISGSCKVLFRNIKLIMAMLLPYMLWLLICQFGVNLLLNPYINEATKTYGEAIANGVASNASFMLQYISLYVVKIVGSCWLCVSLYTALANIYEQDFITCYPNSVRRIEVSIK